MWEVRYLGGFCRIYGQEFDSSWKTVGHNVWLKVRNAPNWEVKQLGEVEEVAEEVAEEVIEEVAEEIVEEVLDLSTMTKKELQTLCDEKGLEYKAFDNKSILLSLLTSEEE